MREHREYRGRTTYELPTTVDLVNGEQADVVVTYTVSGCYAPRTWDEPAEYPEVEIVGLRGDGEGDELPVVTMATASAVLASGAWERMQRECEEAVAEGAAD